MVVLLERGLTMAAPTAIPAKPICTRRRGFIKDLRLSHVALQQPSVNVLTSEIGVSMMRLSPYFFHSPLLTYKQSTHVFEVVHINCINPCMNVTNTCSSNENETLEGLERYRACLAVY